jgi:hypothetical protein
MSTLDLPSAFLDRDNREDDLDAVPEGMIGQLVDGISPAPRGQPGRIW